MYPGGKGSVYQKIINLIPPHQTYIESHLGGGSVMLAKRPAHVNIGIDLSLPALEEMNRVLPGCIVKKSEALPGSIVTNGGTAPPSKIAMRSHTAPPSKIAMRSHTAPPSKIAMRSHIAKGNDDDVWTATPEMARLDHTVHTVINGETSATSKMAIRSTNYYVQMDCVDFFKTYPFTGQEFVYCDPPYLFETRRSKRPIYKFEYSEADHVRLLACLRSLPCPVMISGYWSSLYADTLHDWHRYTYKAKPRSGPMVDEWLWMNYQEPVKLHDYQYLGENFRERERIKRRKTRWGKRLEGMDILERRAILWELQERGFIE